MWKELQKEGYDLFVRAGKFECFPAHPERKIKTPNGIVRLSEKEFCLFIHLITTPRERLNIEEMVGFLGWEHLDIDSAKHQYYGLVIRLKSKLGKSKRHIKLDPRVGYYLDTQSC